MYKEVPKLKFATLTGLVRVLWSGNDVVHSMTKYFLQSERDKTLDEWNNIEECVEFKIEMLHMPKILKIILSSLVKPIGSRIKHIIGQLYDVNYLPNHFMSILNWTFLGTIDAKKTARAAIQDENLPVTKRYEIACNYCLEDEISILWNKLSERNKNDYLCDETWIYSQNYLTIYWTCYMKGDKDALDSRVREIYDRTLTYYGFLDAPFYVNQPAVEYFFGKLNIVEKGLYIMCFFKSWEFKSRFSNYRASEVYLCDMIYFLFSQMNENQRTNVLQQHAHFILKHFLEYPYRGIFLELESYLQKYLTKNQKEDLLKLYKFGEIDNCFPLRNIQ